MGTGRAGANVYSTAVDAAVNAADLYGAISMIHRNIAAGSAAVDAALGCRAPASASGAGSSRATTGIGTARATRAAHVRLAVRGAVRNDRNIGATSAARAHVDQRAATRAARAGVNNHAATRAAFAAINGGCPPARAALGIARPLDSPVLGRDAGPTAAATPCRNDAQSY